MLPIITPPRARLPRLPIQPQQHEGRALLDPDEVLRLADIAATADKNTILDFMRKTTLQHRAAADRSSNSAENLVLMAINPETGDSALHRAAAAGNVDGLHALTYSWFGPQLSHNLVAAREMWVLLMHRNHVGETALHAAARAGSKKGVVALYRALLHDNLDDVEGTRRVAGSGEPAAEYWDWESPYAEAQDVVDMREQAILFLCAKTEHGHDAAAIAREAGHDELAAWLEELVEKLDPEHKRSDDKEMQMMWKRQLRLHCFYESDDDLIEHDERVSRVE